MILREMQKQDKQAVLDMYQEYMDSDLTPGIDRFEGVRNLEHLANMSFEEWLEELELNKDGTRLPESFSPQTTYTAIVDNKIVGLINVRWKLVPVLLNSGGLIGYSIRPSQRRNGYGSEMLRLALKKMNSFHRVLVTCKDSNIASKRVIEKNNGVLENSCFDEDSGHTFLRYWIDLK